MRDFNRRQTPIAILVLRGAGLLLLLFVAGLSVRAAWGMYGTFSRASELRHMAELQQDELEQTLAQVAAATESLDSPRGLEEAVRERYGLGRPGEGEIRIVRAAASTTEGAGENRGMFERLWDSLFVW